MAAALLTTKPLILNNVPRLDDIENMRRLLEELGVEVSSASRANNSEFGQTLTIKSQEDGCTIAPYDLVRKMRASVLVLGPLLARRGEARVSLPGGCAIGTRPIDLHLKGLESLGAEIELRAGYVEAKAPNGLKGTEFRFPSVSVGATENLMMAATLADGITVLENAAREPEISDLGNCLRAMGANIEGLGSDRLVIEGVAALDGAEYSVMSDRIEAGSYAVAAAITGGSLELKGADKKNLGAVLDALSESGLKAEQVNGSLHVEANSNCPNPVDITTHPYPGFPTDMQAQFMTLMACSSGASVITEAIFENRFMHVPELVRMGADITLQGPVAFVRGTERLRGAPVMATDLRASMSLVLAGLSCAGETVVSRIYHLDRGYEDLVGKLSAVGADIERIVT